MEIDFRVPVEGPSAPLWQVFRDKRRVEWTNYESCIPSLEMIWNMKEAGYTFRMHGEIWEPPPMPDEPEEEQKESKEPENPNEPSKPKRGRPKKRGYTE